MNDSSTILEPPPMPADPTILAALAARMSPQTVIRANEPMAHHTTLRVGGSVDLFIEPAHESDLSEALEFCAAHRLGVFMLGRGSNLLVRDGGIRGAVIHLSHVNFGLIEVDGARVRCGAGAKLKVLSVAAKRSGLSGFEFLEGIPGSVGGALRMNAGAMGGAMFEIVESVRFMDMAGAAGEQRAEDLGAQYRSCAFFKDHIALGATMRGCAATRESIEERMAQFSKKRWASQPAAPSAGCIFKNPQTVPAGKLIQELGLKGTSVGGATVSGEHGNFIVTAAGATARDVLELIELIRTRARLERGIELETEVEIVGD